MKRLPLLSGLLLAATVYGQVLPPDTTQRITSPVSPGVAYDVGAAGADGSFSIAKVGGGQRLTIDSSGNVTVLQNLAVNGAFTANNFAGGNLTGGETGLTLSAGGTNQSITLTPSGTGNTILNGKVGLGTANPLEVLQVAGAITATGQATAAVASSSTLDWFVQTAGARLITRGADTSTRGTFLLKQEASNGGLGLRSLFAYANGDIGIGAPADSAPQLRVVQSSGNVGIGTSSPASKLDVAGTVNVQGTLSVASTTGSTSATTGALTVAGGVGVGGDLNIAGKIGIGLGAAVPGAPLDVGTDARIRQDLYVDGVIHVASGNVQAATTTDAIRITSTTDSSGYGTGALIVSGGAGIAKNLYVGGIVDAPYLKVSGQNVWHTGNFNPANYVQQSGGVVSGGLSLTGTLSGASSGLNINSGATGQNIVMNSDAVGRVEVRDTLAITNLTGAQHLLMGNQDSTGANSPAVLRAANGDFQFGRGDSWAGQGGNFTASATLLKNGNVGIGTTSPACALEIARSATGGSNAARLRLTNTSGTSNNSEIQFGGNAGTIWNIGNDWSGNGTNDLFIATVGLDRKMVITNAGNVGIGTTTPMAKLEVKGDFTVRDEDSDNKLGQIYDNGTEGILELMSAGVQRVTLRTNGSSWFMGGNVGIGTTDPTAKLDVAGNTHVGGDLAVTNNASVANQTATGSLAVTASATVGGNATVSGETSTGSLAVTNNASVGGTLGVTSHATIGGNASVAGQTSTSNLVVTNNATINGNFASPTGTVSVGVAQPFADMNAQVHGNLAVTGGGMIHLASAYGNGNFGVRLAGIDNGNGHAFSVLTRNGGAEALFFRALTVTPDGNLGVGIIDPFARAQIEGGILAVTSAAGGTLHLGQNYPNGNFGVRLSARDSGDGQDLVIYNRVAATDGFSESMTVTSRGKVGIGISTPNEKLDVNGTIVVRTSLRLANGGNNQWSFTNEGGSLKLFTTGSNNLGRQDWATFMDDGSVAFSGKLTSNGTLNVNNPAVDGAQIIVNGPQSLAEQSMLFRNPHWNQNDRTSGFASIGWGETGSAGGGLWFSTLPNQSTANSAPIRRMTITHDGNVGIGTAAPGTYKLAVNGSVRAKEVIVDTGWSDYVFAKDYRLAPLAEVERHIQEHQHLPGIPSAKEVAEHGISVGDAQAKLLAKVEELTLHLIAQEKRLNRLEQENAALRAR